MIHTQQAIGLLFGKLESQPVIRDVEIHVEPGCGNPAEWEWSACIAWLKPRS